MTNFSTIISFPLLKAIRFYQKTLSPDHGPLRMLHPGGFCRFYPTCSEYGHQAIQTHGVIKGLALSIWRVLRCHPWAKGGLDPIPNK